MFIPVLLHPPVPGVFFRNPADHSAGISCRNYMGGNIPGDDRTGPDHRLFPDLYTGLIQDQQDGIAPKGLTKRGGTARLESHQEEISRRDFMEMELYK